MALPTSTPAVSELDCLPPPDHPLFALPARVSPHRARLERLILDWADAFELLETPRQRERLAGTRLGDLVARAFPFAREDRLEPLAGWFTWAFVIDDWYDGPGGAATHGHDRALAQVLAALPIDGRPVVSSGPGLVRQLAAVWTPMAAVQSLSWRLRFVDDMAGFMESFAYEAINRRDRHIPAVLPYAQLRRQSGGITPCLHLLEYAAAQEVPGIIRRSDPLRRMFDHTADVVVWVNDVLSLRKELAIGEVSNGVLALAAESNCALPEAIDAVYRRVADHIAAFHCAEKELMAMCGSWRGLAEPDHRALRMFVEGMKCWMRGNLDWSLRSERYVQADTVRLCSSPTLLSAE